MRIAVRLIHAPTEQPLWANSYERDLRDVLDLQREMAQTIAQEIQIKVTPAEQARLARARPVNRKAYLDYLKGRHYWNKRTQESLNKAIEHFQSAIEEDLTYAPAYAGLSDCYALQGTVGIGTRSPRETRPLAVAAARKALQIDGEMAEAHAAIAVIHHYEWEWIEAEQGFRRALELNTGLSVCPLEVFRLFGLTGSAGTSSGGGKASRGTRSPVGEHEVEARIYT